MGRFFFTDIVSFAIDTNITRYMDTKYSDVCKYETYLSNQSLLKSFLTFRVFHIELFSETPNT